MGWTVVGRFSALRSSAHYRCHSVLLVSQGECSNALDNIHSSNHTEREGEPVNAMLQFIIINLFQTLTREKKKIRSEQYRQQVVIPSQNSSNSLPRQTQNQTQKPQSSTNNLNNGKDSGYGKDIKGETIY